VDPVLGYITLAIALISCGAAVFSATAARANKRVAQANVAGRLFAEYSSAEMKDAISILQKFGPTLAKFQTDHTPLEAILRTSDTNFEEAKAAGRRIHNFIRQSEILYNENAISERLFLSLAIETDAFLVWSKFWMPFLQSGNTAVNLPGDLGWAIRLQKRGTHLMRRNKYLYLSKRDDI
jgi:hypothetical protein